MKKKVQMKKAYFTVKMFPFAMVFWCVCFVSNGFAQGFYSQKVAGNDFIEHLDQDNDNKVSLEEFNGPENIFDNLDQDSDGFIGEDEKPEGPPKDKQNNNAKNHLKHLDKNNDGKVSQDEFPGPDDHFTCFDKNEDGYLDKSELPKRPPHRKKREENNNNY